MSKTINSSCKFVMRMCDRSQPFFSELICEPEEPLRIHVLDTKLEEPLLKDRYRTCDIGQGGEYQAESQVYGNACRVVSTPRDSRRLAINIPEDRQTCESVTSISMKGQDRPRAGHFLVILTAEQARSIYLLRRPSTSEGPSALSVAGKSSLVSEMFGVSPKTIRDVWNRKTWTQVPFDPPSSGDCQESHPFWQVTRSLWSEEEALQYARENMTPEQRAAAGDPALLAPKRRGRPPGSKDARPRKRRRAPPPRPPPRRCPSPQPARPPPS